MPELYVAAERFNTQNPGMNNTVTDIYNMMKIAAFELNARPFSAWIQAFTLDEWVSFGYTQDLSYHYCNGPDDKNMKAVGAVYVDATTVLLNEGPSPERAMFWNVYMHSIHAGRLFLYAAKHTRLTPNASQLPRHEHHTCHCSAS